jgi:hypothetical protein
MTTQTNGPSAARRPAHGRRRETPDADFYGAEDFIASKHFFRDQPQDDKQKETEEE